MRAYFMFFSIFLFFLTFYPSKTMSQESKNNNKDLENVTKYFPEEKSNDDARERYGKFNFNTYFSQATNNKTKNKGMYVFLNFPFPNLFNESNTSKLYPFINLGYYSSVTESDLEKYNFSHGILNLNLGLIFEFKNYALITSLGYHSIDDSHNIDGTSIYSDNYGFNLHLEYKNFARKNKQKMFFSNFNVKIDIFNIFYDKEWEAVGPNKDQPFEMPESQYLILFNEKAYNNHYNISFNSDLIDIRLNQENLISLGTEISFAKFQSYQNNSDWQYHYQFGPVITLYRKEMEAIKLSGSYHKGRIENKNIYPKWNLNLKINMIALAFYIQKI